MASSSSSESFTAGTSTASIPLTTSTGSSQSEVHKSLKVFMERAFVKMKDSNNTGEIEKYTQKLIDDGYKDVDLIKDILPTEKHWKEYGIGKFRDIFVRAAIQLLYSTTREEVTAAEDTAPQSKRARKSETIPLLRPINELKAEEVSIPKVATRNETCEFVGTKWLAEQVKTIKEEIPRPGDILKRPLAFVSMPRGGKTRALLELTKALRSEKIPAIYLSYNEGTTANSDEMNDLVNGLCRRLTFALHCKEKNPNLQFLNCGANPKVEAMLDEADQLVLLVDELNRVIPPPEKPDLSRSQATTAAAVEPSVNEQQNLWNFLKMQFLRKNRMLIFSSHDGCQAKRVASDSFFFKERLTARDILVCRLSRVQDCPEEARFLQDCKCCDIYPRLACCGGVPAQVLEFEALGLKYTSSIDCDVVEFARACLLYYDTTCDSLPSEIRSRADFYEKSTAFHYRWSLLWIVHLLCRCKPYCISQSLSSLREFFHNEVIVRKYKVWEFTIAVALILRRLTDNFYKKFMVNCGTCTPSALGFLVMHTAVENVEKAEKWLNDREEAVHTHLVVMPLFNEFPIYDILEARRQTTNDDWKIIAGYQAKIPNKDPDNKVTIPDASWFFSLRQHNTVNKEKTKGGFTRVGFDDICEFLGPCLEETARLLLQFPEESDQTTPCTTTTTTTTITTTTTTAGIPAIKILKK